MTKKYIKISLSLQPCDDYIAQNGLLTIKKKGQIMAKTKNKLPLEPAMTAESDIQELIYTLRGQKVMIDKDLANLYGVETAQLNRQVKRNLERFPDDFMFKLNKEETDNLKCQFGTSSWGGDRHLPYAFTENGVAMLSGVLRSKTAIEVNIRIMRAFNSIRHFLSSVNVECNISISQRVSTLECHQLDMQQHLQTANQRLDEVFRRLDEGSCKPQQGIFYDGQVYDAYTFVADLVKSAKHRIILIDNYIDDTVLTLLDKRNPEVEATIYTSQIGRQLRLDEAVYHVGASIKDLGKKWFGFSKMELLSPEELVERINRG